MAKATFLLPNYNNERVLPFLFASLRQTTDCAAFDLVAVDDGSEDRSLEVLKKEATRCGFHHIEVLSQPHQGVIAALNLGIEHAKTDILVRLDGDAFFRSPGWAGPLLAWLDDPSVGMVGGQILFDNGRVHSLGRSVLSEWGLHDMGTFPAEQPGKRTFDSIVYRPRMSFIQGRPYEVDTLLGVCAAFRRDIVRACGGFDNGFAPVWIEDDDMGLNMRRIGLRVVFDPRIQVEHCISLRGSRQPGLTVAESQASTPPPRPRFEFLKKHLPEHLLQGLKMALSPSYYAWKKKIASQTTPHPDLTVESDPWRMNILQSHYRYWRQKWGFDPINPDLLEIQNRFWETGLCWKLNPSRHAESRRWLSAKHNIQAP
jgi:GT2 family glycosyltransferase